MLGCPNFEAVDAPRRAGSARRLRLSTEYFPVPTFDNLRAVSENRSVYTDGVLAGALYFISPLSLPYVLETLTPQLEAAVAGRAPQKVLEENDEGRLRGRPS